MLRQRVITAVILVAILLPTLVVEAVWPFSLLSLAFISAAGWEWSRLNGAPGARAWLMAAAVAGGSIYAAHGFGLPVWQQPEVLSASQPHVHDVGHPLAGFYTPTGVGTQVSRQPMSSATSCRPARRGRRPRPRTWTARPTGRAGPRSTCRRSRSPTAP